MPAHRRRRYRMVENLESTGIAFVATKPELKKCLVRGSRGWSCRGARLDDWNVNHHKIRLGMHRGTGNTENQKTGFMGAVLIERNLFKTGKVASCSRRKRSMDVKPGDTYARQFLPVSVKKKEGKTQYLERILFALGRCDADLNKRNSNRDGKAKNNSGVTTVATKLVKCRGKPARKC